MKLVALISDGIDSPVAAYIMSKMGAEVVLLHMDNSPYADEAAEEKIISLTNQLNKFTGKEFKLYTANHGSNQTAISETCDNNYQCVMCKRMMQRTAREFAKNIGAAGIIMGDSLGQVASQTLKNIRAENTGLDFPVIRPLIGWDKLEIEALGKEIGTYEISILPAKGCTLVPVKPITEAKPDKISNFESKLDLERLAKETADSATLIQ